MNDSSGLTQPKSKGRKKWYSKKDQKYAFFFYTK